VNALRNAYLKEREKQVKEWWLAEVHQTESMLNHHRLENRCQTERHPKKFA